MPSERRKNGQHSVYTTLGASNHTAKERQTDDFYATEPAALEEFLKVYPLQDKNVWECAVGMGHIAEVLKAYGCNVRCSDIIDRGYNGTEIVDFLQQDEQFDGSIITNPPYKYALEFVEKALQSIPSGHNVIMLLKLQFLESTKRRQLFEKSPPKYIYVSSKRSTCAMNGDFENYGRQKSAMAYAWYVWEKGYKGEPIVRWFR